MKQIETLANADGAERSATMQSIHLSELNDEGERSQTPILKNLNPIRQVKASLQVCVGEAVMSVGELLDAKVHHIVTLDRKVDQLVDLVLEGKVVARGQLVAVDDYFALRIIELPLPLNG